VHAESGLAAWHRVDKYKSGFADKGQLLKDKKHSRYKHGGTAHGLAFYSVGSLAEGAAEAIDYLYAKDSRGSKRNWDSEPSRIAHNKLRRLNLDDTRRLHQEAIQRGVELEISVETLAPTRDPNGNTRADYLVQLAKVLPESTRIESICSIAWLLTRQLPTVLRRTHGTDGRTERIWNKSKERSAMFEERMDKL
jgi:hypothetical protein